MWPAFFQECHKCKHLILLPLCCSAQPCSHAAQPLSDGLTRTLWHNTKEMPMVMLSCHVCFCFFHPPHQKVIAQKVFMFLCYKFATANTECLKELSQ